MWKDKVIPYTILSILDMKMKRGEQNDAHEYFLTLISSIIDKMDQESVANSM